MNETNTRGAHTPGPWDYDYYADHVAFGGHDGREDYTFRVEYCDDMPEGEQIANNHLIAAAPELLQAVEDFILLSALHDWEGAAIDNARAAIAKARGA